MSTSIIKPIIAGIIIGAALFFMPFFVLRVAVVVLIVGLLFRLFGGRRFRRGYGGRHMFPKFADKIRNMSDDEYARFKENIRYGCGGYKTANTPINEK